MRFKEFLHEATRASVSPSQLELVIKNWFKKNVLTPDRFKADVDHHFMEFAEWQEWFGERILKIHSSENRVKIGSNWLKSELNHDVVPGMEDYARGDEWSEPVEKLFNTILKQSGWFVFSIGPGEILFDPIKQKQVEVPQKLYHFSPIWNKDRIVRKGILPKAANGKYDDDYKYPARVHLLTKYDESRIYTLAMHIFNHGTGVENMYHGNLDVPPLVIFEVDVSKCRPGTKFYDDISVNGGVWTYTHIPPEALSIKSEDEEPKEDSGSPF